MATPQQEVSILIKTNATTSLFDYNHLVSVVATEGRREYGPGFNIREEDLPIIYTLLAYALRDEAVANLAQLNLQKGIMLTGPVGCGKTSLMRIIRKLIPDTFKPVIKSCRDVSGEFSTKGFDTIARYSVNAFHPYSSVPRVYCFDDLGVENAVSYKGAKWNVMLEILYARYEYFISHKMITHITTNLNGNELEMMYGVRMRSRMREMFNLICFEQGTADKRI
jgi:DNA replication protein DnaC